MTEEPWNKHIPGDPMPCKCGDSVVEVRFCNGPTGIDPAKYWGWDKITHCPGYEIDAWRFVERKGEDVIAADPYNDLEWDEDDTATVPLKKPGQPEWVRDDDLVRFTKEQKFLAAYKWRYSWFWRDQLAFQIKRRPALTPNRETEAALRAAQAGEVIRVESVDALFADLNNDEKV